MFHYSIFTINKSNGGAEGDVAISIKALSERFGIDESVLRKARKDLEE